MVNLPSSLQSFVESLRVDARGDLCSADRRLGHAHGDPGQLTSTLAGAVYEHVYSRPFPCIPEPPPARDLELTDALEQANTTCARVEHDWAMLERQPSDDEPWMMSPLVVKLWIVSSPRPSMAATMRLCASAKGDPRLPI